jgi:hypothetical protein
MYSKPNHPIKDYTFDSSDNVLPPYSLHQSNGKFHISNLFEKGYPTLPPTFPTLIMIWIQPLNMIWIQPLNVHPTLNVHPAPVLSMMAHSAPFLSMMLQLSPITLSII